jgi:hypothetical protein
MTTTIILAHPFLELMPVRASALANKMARIAYAILRARTIYKAKELSPARA